MQQLCLIKEAFRLAEDAAFRAAANIFALPLEDMPSGGMLPRPADRDQLSLPLRHAGFGLRVATEVQADAAFLSRRQARCCSAPQLRWGCGVGLADWAMPTAQATTLSSYALKAAGRLRLGYGLDTRVALRPCLCRAGEAASAEHAMVCDACKKQRTLRHEILASAWRRVLCNADIAACMEPRYGALVSDVARAAAVGLHRGDILAVIDGSMSALDIVVLHPGASTYVSAAVRADGATAKVVERGKVRDWRCIGGPDSGYDFVPLATETYGRLGVQAARFLKEGADYAACKGVSKSAFTRMAPTELSCALVKTMALVWNAGMFATSRAAGRGFQEGHDVPVADTVLE